MNIFDKYLLKKDKLLKRRIEIDSSLYEKLSKLTEVYDASVNKLVNIAIIELLNTENVQIYESHNFAIRESSYTQMEKLRDKYGLSLYKLTNIAIYNALNSEE